MGEHIFWAADFAVRGGDDPDGRRGDGLRAGRAGLAPTAIVLWERVAGGDQGQRE